MKSGEIMGDGRSKVRWIPEGGKIGLWDAVAGKNRIDARYTLASFFIKADYCESCKKMIFDTEIQK